MDYNYGEGDCCYVNDDGISRGGKVNEFIFFMLGFNQRKNQEVKEKKVKDSIVTIMDE